MKEFVLVFRNSLHPEAAPSPEQMQEVLTNWMNWMASIAAQNKLVDRGNRLSMTEAKTVLPGNIVTDGPYTEIKEFINGYTLIRTASIDEAVEIAGQCPILTVGGRVEVRKVVASDDNS
jgi:hypothetical protein